MTAAERRLSAVGEAFDEMARNLESTVTELAEPEREELQSKIGDVAADLTERLRQLNQTIDSARELSELTLDKELRALRRSNENMRSEFFSALEGVKLEVASAARATATKTTHNASKIIFASISEAVEEKLDALNETLVDAFKRDNPDLWAELAGVRANFSLRLMELRSEMEVESTSEWERAKAKLNRQMERKIEEAEDNFERLINLFNATLIREGRQLLANKNSNQIFVQPLREAKLTREQMIEKIREEKFTRIGDYMYYFSGTSKKYIDAQQFCARVNAYLVEFYDLVQYTAVVARAKEEFGRQRAWWIGVVDHESEGHFYLAHNKVSPLPVVDWHEGEPNNWDGNEDCVEFVNDGWNDNSCAREKRKFVCMYGPIIDGQLADDFFDE